MVGSQERAVWSTQVKCCKGREVRQARTDAKDASRLEPKGMWPGAGVQRSPAADDVPPAERHDLTRSGIDAEHGKPVALPDGGKRAARCADGVAGRGSGSKRRPVCNGLDRGCNITPGESGQTSPWCGRTRMLSQPASGSVAERSARLQRSALVRLPPPIPFGSWLWGSIVQVVLQDQ